MIRGVTDAGRTTNDEQTVKIELLSQWKLEAEFRNIVDNPYPSRYDWIPEGERFALETG